MARQHPTPTTRRTRATRRTARRATLAAGAVTAVLLPLALAAPATAAFGASAPTRVTTAPQDASVVTPVHDFYGAYISTRGEGADAEADALRAENLRTDLRERLAVWEAEHQADGVFRSQNVPTEFDVVEDGSGPTYVWTIVTLYWDDAQPATELYVRSDADTGKISDIRPLND